MFIFVVLLGFGIAGGFWARSKNRNPWGWGILCGLTGLIGLGILAFQKPLPALTQG